MIPVSLDRAPDFAAQLESFAARTALIADDGRRLTYAELAEAADVFAARLAADARLVLIEGRNEIEAIVAYLGVLRSGRVALLHPQGPDADVSRIAAAFTPDAFYTHTGGGWHLRQTGGSTPCHPDLALLLSTSGTTGATKLVRLSKTALQANARSIAKYLELGPDERPITTLPIYYSYGLSVLNSHLGAGAALLLTSRSVVDDDFWRFADEGKATSLSGVPHTYDLLERGKLLARAPDSLRTLTQAGGRLAPQAVRYPSTEIEKRGGRMFVMYGQTEATARIAYMPPHLLTAHPDCIGIAIPGGTLSLRGDDGAEIAGAGKAGELIYRGPNVMMGYALNRDDLTRGAELTELATGDIAERTSDGLYKIVGRRSRFVKPFGLRIALDEIERALEADGVTAMAAGSDALIAIGIIQPSSGGAFDAAALVVQLAERYRLPQTLFQIMPLAERPLLANGKPDYTSLLKRAEGERSANEAPKASVADIFAAILPGLTITPDSSFVSLGGDSLNYVDLTLALEELLGELPRGWETLTIQQLDLLRPQTSGMRPKTSFVKVDSDIALRCVAISAVVAHHSSVYDNFAGGVAALMVLIGFSWARFQRGHLIAAQPWKMLKRLAGSILLPYFGLLTLLVLAQRHVPLSAWTLTANYDANLRGIVLPLWFISSYTQATLLLAVASLTLPAFRESIRTAPFRAGLFTVALTFVVMFVLEGMGLTYPSRSLDQVLPLIAFGWCLAFADTPRQCWGALAAAVLVTMCDMLGDRSMATPLWTSTTPYWVFQSLWLGVTTVALLWIPRITLPRWAAAAAAAVAAASFTIYLTHMAALWAIGRVLHTDSPGIIAALAVIALGALAHQILNAGLKRVQITKGGKV